MSIDKIEQRKMGQIAPLFTWQDSLIWSTLQGHMGHAWADDIQSPSSAQIINGAFCFLAGIPNEELLKNMPREYVGDVLIVIPPNEKWCELLEQVHHGNYNKVTRYGIKKERDIFDPNKLEKYIEKVQPEFRIKLMDSESYHQTMENDWSEDLCGEFDGYADYAIRGLGAVALYQGEVVAGASSYTVYNGGIEIEIDTKESFRRKGLATACGAKLVLACLERGLYPNWDAQNLWSVAIAQKLGYHFDKEYTAYEVFSKK